MEMKGKIALITGAGVGIGKSIAIRFADMGISVIVADLNEESAKETVFALSNPTKEQKHVGIKVDVTSSESVKKMIDFIEKEYGALDILCNNAGVSTMQKIEDLTEDEWNFNFDVNAKGIFLVTKLAFPLLKKQGSARIVNTASMAAVKAAPLLAHYTASKFAVVGFTKSAAIEFAPYNITVNCVCPGFVKTSMQEREVIWEAKLRNMSPEDVLKEYVKNTPLGRLCTPEDVADVVEFLVSRQAGFITGEAVNIAGGANIV